MSRPMAGEEGAPQPGRGGNRAFSLLEILTAVAVLAILVTLSLSLITSSSSLWKNARAKVEMYQEARMAFETMTRKLSQATLNAYWDYAFNADGKPSRYVRASDLHFRSGPGTVEDTPGHAVFFQSPNSLSASADLQGLDGLLNAIGYFVSYDQVNANAPATIANRPSFEKQWAYTLHEVVEPAEGLAVFDEVGGESAWIQSARDGGLVRPLAKNIIALVIWPRLSAVDDAAGLDLAPGYHYDSRENSGLVPQPKTAHQLPPTIHVTMIAVDEATMRQRGFQQSSSPPAAIAGILDGRFTEAANYQADLDHVTGELGKLGINHRVFSAVVPIRESKWSDQ